jgi:hypothetical protein
MGDFQRAASHREVLKRGLVRFESWQRSAAVRRFARPNDFDVRFADRARKAHGTFRNGLQAVADHLAVHTDSRTHYNTLPLEQGYVRDSTIQKLKM